MKSCFQLSMLFSSFRWLPWRLIWKTRDMSWKKGWTVYLNMVSESEFRHRIAPGPQHGINSIHQETCHWLDKQHLLWIITLFLLAFEYGAIKITRTTIVDSSYHLLLPVLSITIICFMCTHKKGLSYVLRHFCLLLRMNVILVRK